LKDCAAYVFDAVELKGGKPVLKQELPRDSAPSNKMGRQPK